MLLESQPKNSLQCYVVVDDQVSAAPEVGYFVLLGRMHGDAYYSGTNGTAPPSTASASASGNPSATLPTTWAGYYNTF